MKKKLLAILLTGTLAVTSLVGCGGGETAEPESSPEESSDGGSTDAANEEEAGTSDAEGKEPVTITFWNGWTGPDGELLKELVSDYNENNQDNVTVEMDIMEFSSLNEKMATALASGTNPNLHLGFATGEYAIDGQYIPINDVFDKTDLDQSDFDEGILANCYYDGNLYGLPFQLTCTYLFWNKDLFEQAGLDPDTPPATWEEVAEYSAKIDALGGNIIGGGYSFNDSVMLGCMMKGYGGNVVADDGNGSYRACLTDPEYIEGNKKALQTVYDFTKQSANNTYTGTDYEAGFMAGTCGMLTAGAWELAGCKNNNLNYGVSLLPAGTEGIKMSTWPISMCVMKGTEGRELEACYSFMEYWNDNIHNKIAEESPAFRWTSQQGYQPYLISVANDDRLTGDPDYRVTSSYIEHYDNYYVPSFWNSYNLGSLILAPLAENVVYETMSIDEALENAQSELEGMIEEMQAKENK